MLHRFAYQQQKIRGIQLNGNLFSFTHQENRNIWFILEVSDSMFPTSSLFEVSLLYLP